MALNVKVGSFNIDSSKTLGQSQSVTGVGFQPKVILFWWSGGTSTGDEVAGGNICGGMGAAVSSSSRANAGLVSDDNVATSNAGRFGWETDCIRIYSDGTPTLDGIADFSSMDSDGFTLTIDDQFSANYRISYLALGGDDLTNYTIGSFETPTSTGEYNAVTGLAYQPDAVLFVSGGLIGNATTNGSFTVGMATASGAQGVNAVYLADANTSSYSQGYCYDGEIFAYGIVGNRDSFVQFNSDGFRLDHLEGTTARGVIYITLKGAQFKVGSLNTRTDGNDIAVSGLGFQPSAILFASANRAKSTQDTVTAHSRISIGAGTSTSNRACAAFSSENGLAATETARSNNDSAVYQYIQDDAIVGQMDIKSIDSDGFTCVMDDSDPSACWVNYLAIGSSGPSSSISASVSASVSASASASVSASPSASPSASVSASPSASVSASPSATPSASPSPTPSASISASPSPSASASASPSASVSTSPSASISASPSASVSASVSTSPSPTPSSSPSSGPPVGSICWGHVTGVLEDNAETFAGNWTGTGSTSGSGDEEVLCLDAGEYMISDPVNTGARTIELLQNHYDETGNDLTLYYRTGATEGDCTSASWNLYSTPFESLGYAQVKVEYPT